MPVIYRIVRETESTTAFDDTLAGACVTDGGTGGTVSPAMYLALLKDDTIVPLPHPGESRRLEEHGETFESARKKQILLRVSRNLCHQCGEFIDTPQLALDGGSGCGTAVLLTGLSTGILAFTTPLHWGHITLIAAAIAFVSLTVVSRRQEKRVQALHKDQNDALQERYGKCPACGGTACTPIHELVDHPLTLTNGEHIHVTRAGIS